jgi:hypothetical protein
MWTRCLMLIATLVVANVAAAESQESSTTPLARKLTAFMKQRGLESVAAHLGPADRRFVAALYLPDQMLIVVAADYSAPALLKERILLEKFRDAYLDLSGASAPSSRVLIQDLGADGLISAQQKGNLSMCSQGVWKAHSCSTATGSGASFEKRPIALRSSRRKPSTSGCFRP